MTDRNPRDTVFRKVLVYPATEDEPRLILKEFSQEGADHPHGLFSTALDLRPSYGKYINDTRMQYLDVTNQPDKLVEGEYDIYYNINVRLPLNRCAAHVVGIDPKHPGAKPFFRGDIFAVKHQKWPGPLIIGGGNHMDWLDFPLGMRAHIEVVLKRLYSQLSIDGEKETWESTQSMKSNPLVQAIEMIGKKQGFGTHKYPYKDRTDRTIAEMEKYRDKQIDREAGRSCTTCGGLGNPELKVCSGCRGAKYCSRECQKADWKNHKKECMGRK